MKEGFSLVDVVSNGFGPRLDRVTMELRLRAAVEQADEAVDQAAGTLV